MKAKTFIIGILVSFALVHAEAQYYLTNGLAAYYPFNGNASDASGNGNDGTIYNASFVAGPGGAANGAIQFIGDPSSYVDVEPTNGFNFTNGITISFWCAIDGDGTDSPRLVDLGNPMNDCIVALRPGSPSQLVFSYSSNSIPDSEMATWTANIPYGEWMHVMAVGTATSEEIWVNGMSIASVTDQPLGDLGQAVQMNIGRFAWPNNDAFDGRISQLRIYNRAFSDLEVQQLYQYDYTNQFGNAIVSLKKAVQPSFAQLLVGTNYQLQVSSDLINWTNQGAAFTATNPTMDYPQYFNVDDWNQLFFRLQVSP